MDIFVATGTGTGQTAISAFDNALKEAGISNYNLIVLSSVIPPGSTIREQKFVTPEEDYGKRLYLVKADMRSRESGKYIGAGLGWYQLPDGRGVFVEHEEVGETEEAVRVNLSWQVKASLKDLCTSRGYTPLESSLKMKVSVALVTDAPTCVLVVAVYKAESW